MKMSLFFRFASVKCPIRNISCVKRLYWTSHSFTFREGLGIRYFMPRTANTYADIQTERMKQRYSIPEEFKVIYNFSHENILTVVSYVSLAFTMVFIYVIYEHKYLMELDEHEKEEGNEPISEELVLQDDNILGVTIEKIKTIANSYFGSQILYSGDPRAKSLVGLAMIISFFYIRSRCVLKIYRHKNNYITVLSQALGSGNKVIEHKANDCCYYPKRKWFQYNLMGKNVIIFSDLFVNYEERQLYIGKRSQ